LGFENRTKLLSVANKPRLCICAAPPARTVLKLMLADEGMYMSPTQIHDGYDNAILSAHTLYTKARSQSGQIFSLPV
jgi:hypothetical protein